MSAATAELRPKAIAAMATNPRTWNVFIVTSPNMTEAIIVGAAYYGPMTGLPAGLSMEVAGEARVPTACVDGGDSTATPAAAADLATMVGRAAESARRACPGGRLGGTALSTVPVRSAT